jgi:hypothetical protein
MPKIRLDLRLQNFDEALKYKHEDVFCGEGKMKIMRTLFLSALIFSWVWSETEKLGSMAYFNEDGAINLAVDASAAVLNLDSPYLMFMLYMGVDENVEATVSRGDVVLVYKNKE